MACNGDLCGIHLLVCSDPQIPALQPPSERAALPPDVGSSLLGLSTFCFFICLDPVLIRPDLEFQSVGVALGHALRPPHGLPGNCGQGSQLSERFWELQMMARRATF